MLQVTAVKPLEQEESNIEVECKYCGKQILVSLDKLKRFKRNGRKFTCEQCKQNIRINASKKASEKVKSLSNEEYSIYCKTRSKNSKKYWDSLTPDQIVKHKKSHHDGIMKHINSLTEEDRKQISSKMKSYWDNMNEKEYNKRCRHISEAWYAQSLPEQQKRLQKLWEGRKNWWDKLEAEDFHTWKLKQFNSINKKLSEMVLLQNQNEIKFIEYLNLYGLKYEMQWHNKTKHPDFDKLFPYNKVTGSNRVMPYHQWDFKVHTKIVDFLIDVDGSMHDYNRTNILVNSRSGITFNMIDYIKFNDSKRPYQTDGLPAYVIQCHDDNITLKTPVIDISNGKHIILSNLFQIMISHDKYEEVIKECYK